MRGTFIKTLIDLASNDPRIMLLTGDLGYMAVEPFRDKFPHRFVNVGVAEQNLVGIATGLAESGFIPFVYSIGTFASLRPYEFIRNGPILHELPVRIVGVGGGFEYGLNGITHYALEDIGIMRVQPEIVVIAPADFEQTRNALLATWDLPGPIYYRIGKDDRSIVRGLDGRFDLGKPQHIRSGADALILTTGSISLEVVKAADLLEEDGISNEVVVVASFNPPPVNCLSSVLMEFPIAFTVEAHYISGGLGSLISEIIAENNINCQLVRCAVTSIPRGISGSQEFMNESYKISGAEIARRIVKELKS
ncbi:MAG: 1-deoxy-D-xylulose-5-phosphate synthase [Anaerolineales bacterium]|nr:1-deoxy-D-xylulose-5-phosphate synthase [Chloroflexota bacterium]MBL6980733.1 1-deoxy-D-xylulose-5-phosphate synthase [Anaerolineales bacterium]